MVSDQEPRYRLVDDEGNIVGSLYGKPDGSVAIQETESGSDREVALAPDGTFSAPSVETESVSTERVSISGVPIEQLDDFEQSGNDGSEVEVSFNIPSDGRYGVRFTDEGLREAQTAQLYYDNDDDSGNFTVWADDGTRESGVNAIKLVESTGSNASISGWVTFTIQDDPLATGGAKIDLTPDRPSRIGTFYDRGGWDVNSTTPSSATLKFPGGLRGGTTIEFWEMI